MSEIVLETSPVISYNGSLEKFIDVEADSSGRGRVWRVSDINAIIIDPKGPYLVGDSVGRYIMKPNSGFQLGHAFRKVIGAEDLKVNSLTVYTLGDTIVASEKHAIWDLVNYDRRGLNDKNIRYDRAIVVR